MYCCCILLFCFRRINEFWKLQCSKEHESGLSLRVLISEILNISDWEGGTGGQDRIYFQLGARFVQTWTLSESSGDWVTKSHHDHVIREQAHVTCYKLCPQVWISHSVRSLQHLPMGGKAGMVNGYLQTPKVASSSTAAGPSLSQYLEVGQEWADWNKPWIQGPRSKVNMVYKPGSIQSRQNR